MSVKLRLDDQTFSSNIVLNELFLLFSNLSHLCIEMVFHCPLFGQTVSVHLAEERFV